MTRHFTATPVAFAAFTAFTCSLACPADALEVIGADDLDLAVSEINLAPGGYETKPYALSNFGEAEETRQGSTAHWQTEGTTIVGSNPTAIAAVQGNITAKGAARIFGGSAQAKLTYQIETRPYELGGGDQYGYELPISLFGTASVDEYGYAEGSVLGSRADGSITILPTAGGSLAYTYSTEESIPWYVRNGVTQDFTGEFWMTPGIAYSIVLNAFAEATINSADGPNALNNASSEVIVDPTFAFDQARYDARRATDPTLPDIQLNDVFYLGISENILTALTGDYNDSGQVEQGDLDLVLSNWGVDTDTAGTPAGWTNTDDLDGLVEQAELDQVLSNWGSTSAPDLTGAHVPEPGVLALPALVLLAARRR